MPSLLFVGARATPAFVTERGTDSGREGTTLMEIACSFLTGKRLAIVIAGEIKIRG